MARHCRETAQKYHAEHFLNNSDGVTDRQVLVRYPGNPAASARTDHPRPALTIICQGRMQFYKAC